MKRLRIALSLLLVMFFVCATAQTEESWQTWVRNLRTEAINDGIKPQLFDEIFSEIPGPSAKVLHYYNTQPERRLTLLEYRHTRANEARINMGHKAMQEHHTLLQNIGRDFGVDPCVAVSLWGLETDYGHFMGNFPVISSLATLAYDSKRPAFFRHELLLALHIVQQGQVSVENFKGEWAGASGYPQFLPSSWFKYAVDYEKNGHKDIWKSLPDGLASIANYLAKNGWKTGQPWAIEVTLPAQFSEDLLGKSVIKTVTEWQHSGVHLKEEPNGIKQLPASIIKIGGEEGITLMIFDNFRVLQTWNDSNFYVSTVGYLANHICHPS